MASIRGELPRCRCVQPELVAILGNRDAAIESKDVALAGGAAEVEQRLAARRPDLMNDGHPASRLDELLPWTR